MSAAPEISNITIREIDEPTEMRAVEELQKEIGEIAGQGSEQLSAIVKRKVIPRLVSFGSLIGQYLGRKSLDDQVVSARQSFARERSELAGENDRRKLDRAIEAAVTLRRIDALIYLHRSMKVWLPPHVATTSLMLALMIVHIIQVIYYASR